MSTNSNAFRPGPPAYDADSRRTSLTLPNGISLNYGYDAASQLTSITYMSGSTIIGNLTYTYDLAGQRTGVGGTYARTNAPQAASTAPYNLNNQLTQWKGASLTYDANGNLTGDGTNTYTWNARNQLVSISGVASASFQYDPFGRRVSKTIGGTTQYLYDGVNPVQEISGTTASANLLTGGVDEYFQRTDSAGARNFLTDALGSTLALADSSGTIQTQYTFEPFGNTTATGAATTNSFEYTGRELDASGLYYYRARYYNPQLQRFISEDPAGFYSGVNFYTYALDLPTYWIDPTGLDVTIKQYPGNNIWGHIGLNVNDPNTVGFYPVHNTGASPGKVIPDDPNNEGTPEACIIIPTSPQQDQDILNFIKSRKLNPGWWRPGRDCANFVHDALKAAGINVDDSTFPRDLMNNLKRQVSHTSCVNVTPLL
jgi:RHS repeat-associated protein